MMFIAKWKGQAFFVKGTDFFKQIHVYKNKRDVEYLQLLIKR